MKVYLFKVRDYTTTLVGQYNEAKECYYIQRGDGNIIAEYTKDRITYSKLIHDDSVEKNENNIDEKYNEIKKASDDVFIKMNNVFKNPSVNNKTKLDIALAKYKELALKPE